MILAQVAEGVAEGVAARPAADAARPPRSWRTLAVMAVLGVAGVASLTSLGVWQLQRRAWKHDLIERVEGRIHAPPAPAPAPASWPAVTAASHEYRHVTVTGRFIHDRETLVQALTDRGGGFWVMAPMRTDDGFTVLVNRGFVPADARDPGRRTADGSAVTVTGLLRLPEPGGTLLRGNDAGADRWYSRDVAAIATRRGLGAVAPYFIDADAAVPDPARNPGANVGPVGGLTVVQFPDNHLVYALTWLALDLLLIGGVAAVARDEWLLRAKSRYLAV